MIHRASRPQVLSVPEVCNLAISMNFIPDYAPPKPVRIIKAIVVWPGAHREFVLSTPDHRYAGHPPCSVFFR